MMGILYDWDREVTSCLPDYYHWTGVAPAVLRARTRVPRDGPGHARSTKTVLANEQVINGRCWRHPDVEVEETRSRAVVLQDH